MRDMRQSRIIVPEARYHITAKTHASRWVFEEPAACELFLKVIARAREKFHFRLENLCLMSNHVHMILQPASGESLSGILQWIFGVFAQTWNRIHGFVGGGPVWAQRFFSRVISSLRAYWHTFLYIDANPAVAGLVDRETPWAWARVSLLQREPPFVLDPPPKEDLGFLD